MIREVGFDTDKYLDAQVERILERVSFFDKLYLEFGGKLCYDNHAYVCFQVSNWILRCGCLSV